MRSFKTTKIIVAEYSVRNRAFNVSTLADAMRNNKDTALKGLLTDFVIFGAFETYDQAEEACRKMQLKQDAWEEKHGPAAGYEDIFAQEDDLYEW